MRSFLGGLVGVLWSPSGGTELSFLMAVTSESPAEGRLWEFVVLGPRHPLRGRGSELGIAAAWQKEDQRGASGP